MKLKRISIKKATSTHLHKATLVVHFVSIRSPTKSLWILILFSEYIRIPQVYYIHEHTRINFTDILR